MDANEYASCVFVQNYIIVYRADFVVDYRISQIFLESSWFTPPLLLRCKKSSELDLVANSDYCYLLGKKLKRYES